MDRRIFLGVSGTFGFSVLAGCSGLTQRSRETVPSEEITAYESLSDQGKELFREIVDAGPIERASDRIPPMLSEAEYVRYQKDVYRLSKTNTQRYIAEYTLEVGRTSESEIDESERVAYPDLSEAAQNAFKQALEEGSYTVRDGSLPGELREVEFVKYDGSYYELRIIVADIPVWELSAIKNE